MDLIKINKTVLEEIIKRVCKKEIEKQTRDIRFELERLRKRIVKLGG